MKKTYILMVLFMLCAFLVNAQNITVRLLRMWLLEKTSVYPIQ